MALFRKSDRAAISAGLWSVAIIAIVMSLVALVTAINNDGGGGGGSADSGAVTVTLSEFKIDPASISVPEGGSITVDNAGAGAHNLYVEGSDLKTPDIQAGGSETLDVSSLKAGSYTVYCAIAGHREAGMEATLNVGSGGAAGGDGHSGLTDEELLAKNDKVDDQQADVVTQYVAQLGKIVENFQKTGKVDASLYEPNTSYGEDKQNPLLGAPVLEPKMDGNVKVYDITAKIVDWEVSPGKTVKAWTYNGMVPGPTIQVQPGDTMRINFTNDLPQSTAIHFHGIETPIDMDGVPFVTQPVVKPGEKFTYEFTLPNHVSVGMYHSHHHAENQVPNGLAGALLVGNFPMPAEVGKDAPDLRLPMVLNDAGNIGLSLNGKSFPATAPVVAFTDQWIQIDYYNEGLLIHPMHLHGLPQLVIGKDGFAVPTPYQVDTLNVAPGERYSVLVHAEPRFAEGGTRTPLKLPIGVWAYHCHILNHAEREDGMFGMVTTFIVIPKEAAA